MSLIGSLEDLNLGDILQIIYLSQKSGALVIRSEAGEGRISFREGLVCGGVVKGGPTDLRGLLVDGGLIGETEFDSVADACEQAAALGPGLVERELISAERLESLLSESIEAAVAAMFQWSTGEFSFDLMRDSEGEEYELLLARGINPQFLAMERVRLEDESDRGAGDEPEIDPDEMSAEEMFGVGSAEPEAEDSDAVNTLAMASAERVEGQLDEDAPQPVEPKATVSLAAMIVIEPDLVALEWVKDALKSVVDPIHIFQRSDLGLNRIRQYLARAQTPFVLVSPAIVADRSAGIRDASDFVRRLKSQSPSMKLMWLCEEGGEPAPSAADGCVTRPAARAFRNPGAVRQLADMAGELRDALAGGAAQTPVAADEAAASPGECGSA